MTQGKKRFCQKPSHMPPILHLHSSCRRRFTCAAQWAEITNLHRCCKQDTLYIMSTWIHTSCVKKRIKREQVIFHHKRTWRRKVSLHALLCECVCVCVKEAGPAMFCDAQYSNAALEYWDCNNKAGPHFQHPAAPFVRVTHLCLMPLKISCCHASVAMHSLSNQYDDLLKSPDWTVRSRES